MPEAAVAPAPVTPAPVNAVPAAGTPTNGSMTTLAVAVVTIAALYFGREVFVPLAIAVLLVFVLAPLVNLLRRLALGRAPAVGLAVLLALGVIVAVGGTIGLQVAGLAGDLPRYEQTFRAKIAALKDTSLGRAAEAARNLGKRIENAAESSQSAAEVPIARPGEPAVSAGESKPLAVEVRQPDPSALEIAQRLLGPVLHPLATAGIVLVVVIFILMQREDLRDRMIRLFGSTDLHRTTVAMDDAAKRLSRYFLTQLALNTAFGVFVAVGLWIIGVPSPVLWGVFAAVMRFIPYIGSFLAGALPALLAAAVDPGWTMVIWTVALFAVSEPLMGHVIEPMVYGQGTGLSPFAVVVAAIFWTWLWGPVGLILAMPLTLCLVVLGRHVERLEFLDVLLGDRPALTPAENFYQRMLAGDPDEAEEYAEQLLKERSLSSYYDEVALKGLQLAANDAKRGVLGRDKLEAMRAGVATLVAELDSYDDVEPAPKKDAGSAAGPTADEKEMGKAPPPADAPAPEAMPAHWRHDNAILCVAGRGPLDEGAATMLAQLLRKHGLGARAIPFSAISRQNIGGLDTQGTAMVCISYLDISGAPAHLRYLIRRMRQRLPDAPVLVGLWPAEDTVLTDEALRRTLGADHYVVSLCDAVAACVAEAAKARAETVEIRQGVVQPPPAAVPTRPRLATA